MYPVFAPHLQVEELYFFFFLCYILYSYVHFMYYKTLA